MVKVMTDLPGNGMAPARGLDAEHSGEKVGFLSIRMVLTSC